MNKPTPALALDVVKKTRPPMARMLKIFQAIKSEKFPNRVRLAKESEVALKTIQRDIDFMRDQYGLPIDYSKERGGYYFTQPVQGFPMMELSEAELVSVFVAQKALTQYQNTPFEQPLRSAFSKLTSSLDGTVTVAWDALESFVAFRSPDTVLPPEAMIFQVVSGAVRLKKVLLFQYKKLDSAEYLPRRVEPYQLLCYKNQWYCIGHDPDREAMRTFVLSRMRAAVLGVDEFQKPSSFSVETHFKNSFGVFSGSQKLDKVLLRFDSTIAQLIRERIWHPSQSIQELAEGELELSLQVNNLLELEAWVMSWGDHVQVLKPKELITRLHQMAKNLVQKYESS